mmetsp:Transcript_17135/g.49554  ORF Transcript_17135/g.49554 Transcript_17135/m.49554 type:complete len:755 (-) Transcript_17135:140-2404(-)
MGFGKCCPGLFARCRRDDVAPPPKREGALPGDDDDDESSSSPDRHRSGAAKGADAAAAVRSFQHNMLRENPRNADVLDHYDILEIIGEGSISTIAKARKRNVGGSARLSHAERRRRRRRKEGKMVLPDWGGLREGWNGFVRACGFGAAAKRKRPPPASWSGIDGGGSIKSGLIGGGGGSSSRASGGKGEPAAKLSVVKKKRRAGNPQDESDVGERHAGGEGGSAAQPSLDPPLKGSSPLKPSSAFVSSALASQGGSDSGSMPYTGLTSSTAPSSSSQKTERCYALKTINLRLVKEEYLQELRNEIEIFKHLDHPNIAKAYETYCRKNHLCIVMELCTGGDLHVRAPYTEREACNIIGKLLSAVAYMHKNNVMHRDLKYENILFETRHLDSDIKLIDFGLAKKYLSPDHVMTERVGTIYTMAPEVVKGVYTFKADLWSVGVIAYMLLSNTKPFWGKKKKRIVEKIVRGRCHFLGPEWALISREARFFVRSLIQVDPEKRLTAEQAQVHPWLTHSYKLCDRRPSEDLIDRVNENIVRYADSGEFKKVILNVIAHKSTAEEIFQLRKVFDQYDRNNDGAISYNGFKDALSKFNYTDEELNAMFRCVDINENGFIFYTEFLAAALEAQGRIEEERLAEAFDRIDSDNTGYISRENVCQIVGSKCTKEYAAKLLAEADVDKDGQVSYEEFLSLFLSQKNHEICEIYEADTRPDRTSEPLSSSSSYVSSSSNEESLDDQLDEEQRSSNHAQSSEMRPGTH